MSGVLGPAVPAMAATSNAQPPQQQGSRGQRGNGGGGGGSGSGSGPARRASTLSPLGAARDQPQSSFLSLEEISPQPDTHATSFADQQQQRQQQQQQQQQGTAHEDLVGDRRGLLAAPDPSLGRTKPTSRGMRLGNQLGKLWSSPAPVPAPAAASAPKPVPSSSSSSSSSSPSSHAATSSTVAVGLAANNEPSTSARRLDNDHVAQQQQPAFTSDLRRTTASPSKGAGPAVGPQPMPVAEQDAGQTLVDGKDSHIGPQEGAGTRPGGRLSRLQYKAAEGVSLGAPNRANWSASSRPSPPPAVSAASIAAATTAPSAAGRLRGRASNPNLLLSAHATAASGSSGDEGNGLSPNPNLETPTTTSSMWRTQSTGAAESGQGQHRDNGTAYADVEVQPTPTSQRSPATQRELYLPALRGMRTAVANASTTPSQAFMRKSGRRTSYSQGITPATTASKTAAVPQPDTADDGIKCARDLSLADTSMESDSYAQPQGGQNPAARTSIASTSTGTATAMEATPRPSRDRATPQVSRSAVEASPAAVEAFTPRNSLMGSNDQLPQAGHLSDATIAQLGALPGVQPTSLLRPNGQPLSSKNILTIALQKAQSAVLLDGSNNVPEAMLAYRQAVRLLQEVMERVSPRNARSNSRRGNREEERRRLKIIHDTYADRIRLLSMIYSPDENGDGDGDGNEDRKGDGAVDGAAIASLADDTSSDAQGKPVTSSAQQLTEQSSASDEQQQQHQIVSRNTTTTEDFSNERRAPFDSEAYPPSIAVSMDGKRGESVNSYSSATASAPSNRALQVPPSAGLRTGRPGPSSLEEAYPTPATPYFDFDPDTDVSSATEEMAEAATDATAGAIGAQPGSGTAMPSSRNAGTTPSSGLRPHMGSRSPSERTGRISASLSNVPTATAIRNAESRAPKRALSPPHVRRTNSSGSDTSFRHLMSRAQMFSDASPAIGRSPDPAPLRSPPYESQPPGSGGGRRRASTLMAGSVSPTEAPRNLVSASTASGTISQRRKQTNTGNSPLQNSDGFTTGTNDGVPAALRNTHPNFGSPLLGTSDTTYQQGSDAQTTTPTPGDSDDGRTPRSPLSPGWATGSRKRAMSQPNSNRRPSIPAAFLSADVSVPGGTVPPVPRVSRKASMPLSGQTHTAAHLKSLDAPAGTRGGGIHNNGKGSYPIASQGQTPSPSSFYGYHSLATPLTAMSLSSPLDASGATLAEIFPSALPSMQVCPMPSFASCLVAAPVPWLGVTSAVSEYAAPPPLPPHSESILRPYQTMRQLHASIEHGAWLTPKLYIPRDVWHMASTRIVALEAKVRMLEVVFSGIDAVEQAGHYLLHKPGTLQPGLLAINATRFVKQLDEFDVLLIDVQSTLVRKCAYIEPPPAMLPSGPPLSGGVSGSGSGSGSMANTSGQSGGTNSSSASAGTLRKGSSSFGTLSSKLSRSLDRMVAQSKGVGGGSGGSGGSGSGSGGAAAGAGGAAAGGGNSNTSVESQHAPYIEALDRTCVRAVSVLGEHTAVLVHFQQQQALGGASDGTEGYASLTDEVRSAIYVRLRRASDFYANVVLRFVLRDMAILMDKSMKRGAAGLME